MSGEKPGGRVTGGVRLQPGLRMTVFWVAAALFLAGGLIFLLPSLLNVRAARANGVSANVAVHRDQLRETEADLAQGLISPEQQALARREIERRVLEDTAQVDAPTAVQPARRTALALALLLPLASVLTYLQLGRPDAVVPQIVSTPAAPDASARHGVKPEQIQQMAAALAERLQAQPQDLEGWLMLGRSYTALGRYADAVAAFRRAQAISPQDAGILADLADLTGMAQGKRLAGEPARLIQRALDLDPRHVKALALAGSAAFEMKDYAAARGYWGRLLAVVPADSPMAKSMQGSLAEAARLEGTGGQATAPVVLATASATKAISGEVRLSAELQQRVAAGDTLFVFARAAEGSRMPLAIVRLQAQGEPVAFTLDDSQAMSPNQKLSGAASVVVGARISRSGQATPQSGDLVGQSAPLAPGTRGLVLVVDRVQP